MMYHQPSALPGLGGAYLYQWNDDRCNMKHNFICKYGPGSVSQSAAGAAEPTGFCHLSSRVPSLSESSLVKEQHDAPSGRGTGEHTPEGFRGNSDRLRPVLFLLTAAISCSVQRSAAPYLCGGVITSVM